MSQYQKHTGNDVPQTANHSKQKPITLQSPTNHTPITRQSHANHSSSDPPSYHTNTKSGALAEPLCPSADDPFGAHMRYAPEANDGNVMNVSYCTCNMQVGPLPCCRPAPAPCAASFRRVPVFNRRGCSSLILGARATVVHAASKLSCHPPLTGNARANAMHI